MAKTCGRSLKEEIKEAVLIGTSDISGTGSDIVSTEDTIIYLFLLKSYIYTIYK